MKGKKLRVALMSALVVVGGVSLTLGSLTSCGETVATYAVTYTASSDYTISIASGTTYAEGDNVSFTVTVASDKVLDKVTANGSDLPSSDGVYSFVMPASDVVIEVTVSSLAAQYTFEATATGEWGTTETLTITATVNATPISSSDLTVTATTGANLVTISGNTVTLNDVGDVVLLVTTTYNGVELSDTISGTVVYLDYSISQIVSTGNYTVRGVVVGKDTSYVVIHDGEAGVAIWGSSGPENLEIGEYIQVSGTTSTYNNTYQFTYSSATIKKLDASSAPTVPNAVDLDANTTAGLASGTVATTDIIKYKWRATVTEYTSGSYFYHIFTMNGSSYTMESTSGGISSDISITADTTYDLEGYYIGYFTNSYGTSYAYFVITSATEAVVETISGEDLADLYAQATSVTVSELLAITPDGNFRTANTSSTLYKVTGIVEDITITSAYGNFYLTDKSTGETILNYGCGTLYSAMTYSEGTFTYSNSQTFITGGIVNQISEGDEITVIGIYGTYGETYELLSEFVEVVTKAENNAIYQINSIPDYLQASKTSGLTYGEEITLSVVEAKIPEGYVIDTVYHNGTIISTNQNGTYTIYAGVKNEITATLRDENEQISSLTITPDAFGTSYNTSAVATSNLSYNVTLAYYNIAHYTYSGEDVIQMRVAGSSYDNSELWNTTETPAEIASVTFTISNYWTNQSTFGNSIFNVSFGTEAMTNEDTKDSYQTVQPNDSSTFDYTVECDVNGAKYFNIERSGSYASYLASITINFVVSE